MTIYPHQRPLRPAPEPVEDAESVYRALRAHDVPATLALRAARAMYPPEVRLSRTVSPWQPIKPASPSPVWPQAQTTPSHSDPHLTSGSVTAGGRPWGRGVESAEQLQVSRARSRVSGIRSRIDWLGVAAAIVMAIYHMAVAIVRVLSWSVGFATRIMFKAIRHMLWFAAGIALGMLFLILL